MLNAKTLFPYLFGLASLIISIGIAAQGKLAEAEPLPSPTPTATASPQPVTIPQGARWDGCRPVSRPRSFFYIPPVTASPEERITITGTVYTSDFSPLPDALIEISQPDPGQANSAYPPPAHLLLRTDQVGRYGFTVMKPPPSQGLYLHYQITAPEGCPFLMHMHLMVELPSQAVKPSSSARVIEVSGPVLQGPVDIVLPGTSSRP